MFQPTKDRILCKQIPEQNQIGDILSPDMPQERPYEYLVLAVGPDCQFVREGQTILLPTYSTLDSQIGEHEISFAHESEVIAIVEYPCP
jgi:co-chaperonin GroES (HSP10)